MGIGKRAVIGFCMIVLAGVVAAEELGAKRPAPRPETLAAPFIDGAEAAGVKEAPALAAPQVQPAIAKPRVPPRDPTRGSVTNLPLPRFVSLKGNEGNARRGPGLTHRIDWVFTRSGMPLRITAEYEHWRRIEDADGAGGWVHYALLSGVRSALVTADVADFRDAPRDDAEVSFQAERNVVGWIQECVPDWCRLSVDGEKGWVRTSALWGVDPGEVIE